MAAKKNNSKRAERIAKSTQNLNNALSLFTAGFIAEFYLLMVSNYFVKGTVTQLVAAADFLEYVQYIGLVVLIAGIALIVMRQRKLYFLGLGKWLAGSGLFLAASAKLMLSIYPGGTTALCILVPVAMLLAVVYFLYEREFALETIALALTIGSAVLVNRSSVSLGSVVNVLSGVLALVFLALAVGGIMAKKDSKPCLQRIYGTKPVSPLFLGVMLCCFAATVAALLVAGVAYYVVWGGAIVLFALAVYYTVKML